MRQKYPFFYLSTQTRDIRISVEPDRSPLDYFALEDIVARLYENGEDFVVLGYIPSAKYAQNHHYIQTTLEDDGNPQSHVCRVSPADGGIQTVCRIENAK